MERLVEILEILEQDKNSRMTFAQICEELKKLEPKKYSIRYFLRSVSRITDNLAGGFEHWVQANLDVLNEGSLIKRWRGIGEQKDEYAITPSGLARITFLREMREVRKKWC